MNANGWYVYKIGGYLPSYCHDSHDSAQREAERLFGNLGGEYLILHVVGRVKPAPKCIVEDYRHIDPLTEPY